MTDTFYMRDPHLSEHHGRMIYAHVYAKGKRRRLYPLTRGQFGKPERRKGRVWVDFRAKIRGPHRAPRITIYQVKP